MPLTHIVKETKIERSFRVKQLEGLFDIPELKIGKAVIECEFPKDFETREWTIGAICGPSGSGKSTILNDTFGGCQTHTFPWPKRAAFIDAFPKNLSIQEIVNILSSIGFSSPPSWMKPFHALSNGEQFRASVARAIAANGQPIVIDEFTSVVDRQVAKVACASVAKYIRRAKKQLVIASCHYDIVKWLQPDWLCEPHLKRFQWRYLQRRSPINLVISRTTPKAWELFKSHHYLTGSLHRSAQCYCATWGDEPVAFCAVLNFPHAYRPGYRLHRTVCLPDYQGVGVGNALSEYVASLYAATGRPVYRRMAHPGLIAHCRRSPLWRERGKASIKGRHTIDTSGVWSARLCASFEYIGPHRTEEAKGFGLSLQKTHRAVPVTGLAKFSWDS